MGLLTLEINKATQLFLKIEMLHGASRHETKNHDMTLTLKLRRRHKTSLKWTCKLKKLRPGTFLKIDMRH